MMRTYQVCSGTRSLGLRQAPTAHAALLDYVRSLGCHDDEVMRLGEDTLSWRGAVFRAVPLPDERPTGDSPADVTTSGSQRASRAA